MYTLIDKTVAVFDVFLVISIHIIVNYSFLGLFFWYGISICKELKVKKVHLLNNRLFFFNFKK
jgi:hypothetical protein